MNYGNVILITVICIVIFWVFMALRPVKAAEMLPHPRPLWVGSTVPIRNVQIHRAVPWAW